MRRRLWWGSGFIFGLGLGARHGARPPARVSKQSNKRGCHSLGGGGACILHLLLILLLLLIIIIILRGPSSSYPNPNPNRSGYRELPMGMLQ